MNKCVTFVIPSTPMFGLEEVDPFPVPKRPSSMQESPSTNIPLQRRQTKPPLRKPDANWLPLHFIKVNYNREYSDRGPVNGMDGGRWGR